MSSTAQPLHEPPPSRIRDLLAIFLLPTGTLTLLIVARHLDAWVEIAGWVALFLLGCVLLQERFKSLVGPVLIFEMVRTARRMRVSLLRSVSVTVLLVVIFAVYLSWFGHDVDLALDSIFDAKLMSPNELPRFAASIFETVLIAQYLLMMVMTPILCGGAITEEREKGTIAYLLTTHLTTREILIGKLLGRVSHLVFLMLAGVPVLALLQLLGGVDAGMLVVGLGCIVLLTLSVASLCLLISVYCQRTQTAVVLALIGTAVSQVLFGGVGFATLSSIQHREGSPTVVYLLPSLVLTGGTMWICLGEAFRGLRNPVFFPTPIPRRAPGRASVPPPEPVRPLLDHPPIGDGSALIWKEIYVGGHRQIGPGRPDLSDWLSNNLLPLSLAILTPLLLLFERSDGPSALPPSTYFLIPLLICGVAAVCAYVASRSIVRERDQRTLESLLATDLTNDELLNAKWLGIVFGWRNSAWTLTILLVVAGVCGFNPILGVPLVLAGAGMMVAFAINLGLYCSLVCSTSHRASVFTMGILLAVTVGHWVLFPIGIVLLQVVGRPDLIASLRDFHLYALTPPRTLAALATLGGDWGSGLWSHETLRPLWMAVLGVVLYSGAGGILWLRLRASFGPVTGRMR